MSMYTCLIADDQMIERDLLLLFVSKISRLKLVGVCKNGLEIAEILQKESVDIIFTDVDMPELSGIGLVKSLQKKPVVVFISSYPEYAVESFNLDAVDFIVKPLQFERFLKGANKAMDYIELKKSAAELNQQFPETTLSATADGEEFFFIKDNLAYIKIFTKDVVYIESMGDFSRIHTIIEKTYTILVSMKKLELQLSSKVFMRVHKQFIINLHHLISLKQNEITLTGEQQVLISNVYKQALLGITIEKKLLKRS